MWIIFRMLFLNKYYLCITFLCVVDAEISKKLSTTQPLIWESVNNSAFLLRLNNGSKNEISNDTNWFLNTETLNSILERTQEGNSRDPPSLRKRETVNANHSESHPLSSDHHDDHFTIYYNGNASEIDQAHFRIKKQANEEYYRVISEELKNITAIEQAGLPRSPIASILNKTSRTIEEGTRNIDITVIPMPILTSHEEDTANLFTDQKIHTKTTVSPFKPNKLKEVNIDGDDSQFETETSAKDLNRLDTTTYKYNSNEGKDPKTKELDGEKEEKEITITRAAIPERNFATNIKSSEEITSESILSKTSKHIDKVTLNHEDNFGLDILHNQENKSMSTESNFYPNISSMYLETSQSSSSFNNSSTSSFKEPSSAKISFIYPTTTSAHIFQDPNSEMYPTTRIDSAEKYLTTTRAEEAETDINVEDYEYEYESFGIKDPNKLNKQSSSISTKEVTTFTSEAKPGNSGDRRATTSTTTTTTFRPYQPEVSLAEVKIIPIKEREYAILLTGIVLCCLGIVLIIGGLIIYFYQKKKSTLNDIELVTSMRFDENENEENNVYRPKSSEMTSGYVSAE